MKTNNEVQDDEIFTETFCPFYYSVIVPWVSPRFQTVWHPTESTGTWAVLSRGAFKTRDDAIAWAVEHLRGAPYSLRTFACG